MGKKFTNICNRSSNGEEWSLTLKFVCVNNEDSVAPKKKYRREVVVAAVEQQEWVVRGLELDDFWSIPTQAVLWFYDMADKHGR